MGDRMFPVRAAPFHSCGGPMTRRILFDGYWLTDGPPSGRNVVIGLINGWALAHPEDDLHVAVQPSFDRTQLGITVTPVVVKSGVRNHGAWVLTRLGRLKDSFDAIVSQNFTPIRVSGSPRLATFFHDAIFRTNPEWFTRSERAYLRVASITLGRADVVLTSTVAERERIKETHRGLRAPVHGVGLALPDSLTGLEQCAGSQSSSRKFILCVGRLNARKNVRALIEAFSAASLPEHELVIVGTADGKPIDAASSTNVKFLGGVDDRTLARLYRDCDFFVFPSLDEGFGLPLLEAAHFGAPTAASDIPAFREVGTPALYFDPRDTSSIVGALKSMATVHNRGAIRSTSYAPRYSWKKTAQDSRAAIFPELSNANWQD